MKRHGTYNRIALLVTVLFIAFTGFLGVRGLFYNALALEQEVRCGIPAHTHGTMCYDGHRRVCGQEEHSHNRNCYIVLLEDNDINDLLVQMSASVDNSLESVINQTVNNALVYNTNLTSPLAAGTTLADVAALNSTVEENNVTPSVVFNENIQTRAGSNDMLGAALPTAPDGAQTLAAGTGSSTLALGDGETTEEGQANYYVLLDNEWTHIGTLPFSVTESGNSNNKRYGARASLSEVLNLYNRFLGTSFAYDDVSFTYSNDGITAQNWITSPEDRWNNRLYFQSKSTVYYSDRGEAYHAKSVRLHNNNGGTLSYYTVTLNHADGDSESQIVRSDTTIRLPGNSTNIWRTPAGKEYRGGTQITVNDTYNLTSDTYAVVRTLTLNYNVNFPSSISNVTRPTRPTLLGTTLSTATETVSEGNIAVTKSLTAVELKGAVNDKTSTDQHRVIRFMGWRVNDTDVIVSHNTELSWNNLEAYAGSDDTITLTGVWEYNALQTASFFIRYDSVAADYGDNVGSQGSEKYTNEVFAAFVMGVDTSLSTGTLDSRYGITDETQDNSYTADQEIRALYGQKAEGVWFTSFPKDEDIFELLKPYANTGNLRVATSTGTEVITTDQLNANYCSIRWYVFKSQGDAWHIDGRLVKKEGILDITKTFAGNRDAIAAAKEHFSITAKHDVANGKQYTLTLAENDPFLYEVSNDGNTYHWRITDLTYGQPWVITENNSVPDNVLVHTDYRVVDTYGSDMGDQDAVGVGVVVKVKATTVATDMDVWYPLTVNFTNIYHNTDSIIIKKEDERTGNPLGGAVFQLLQNGEPMKFVYDSTANVYRYQSAVPDGTEYVTQLAGSASGYYELNIQGFKYSKGNIVVQEVKAPDGYTPIGDVIIGYELDDDSDDENSGEDGTSTASAENTETTENAVKSSQIDNTESFKFAAKPPGDSNLPPGDDTGQGDTPDTQQGDNTNTQQGDGTDTQQGDNTDTQQGSDGDDVIIKSTRPSFNAVAPVADGQDEGQTPPVTEEREVKMLSDSPMAEYRNGLLIIRNSTENTSVTVKKEWRCLPDNWKPVTMQLLANGAPVTSLLSEVKLTQVLDTNNNWTATWGDLPQYANGQPITWSVREIKIGDEECLSDYKFVNWLVTYGPGIETTSNGRVVNTSFTVTNDTYRTLLYVLKTDRGGGVRLAGAEFTLERMRNGNVDQSFTPRSGVTNAEGMITFDTLEHGDYRLTETSPPSGYEEMTEPIYLTLRTDGTVAVQAHDYALSGGTYTVHVLNEQMRPLPATGGIGDTPFYLLGLLLMVGAVSGAWFSHRRREGVLP